MRLQIIDGAANVDWQLAGMAAKTLWNYLTRLKRAIDAGQGEEVMYTDQMSDLVELLDGLLGTSAL